METMPWSKTKAKTNFISILGQKHTQSYQKTGPILSCYNPHQMGKHSDDTAIIPNQIPALSHYTSPPNQPPAWIWEPATSRSHRTTINRDPFATTKSTSEQPITNSTLSSSKTLNSNTNNTQSTTKTRSDIHHRNDLIPMAIGE